MGWRKLTMKMSKAKRKAAAEDAAARPYIVAYATCGRDAHGTPIVKPVPHRYGPDQFRFHLENVMVMAETSLNNPRVITLGRFLRGELRFYTLAGVVYENKNYREVCCSGV